MKKIVGLLIALCLIIGLMPLAALAADEVPEKHIRIRINNGTDYYWYYAGKDAEGKNIMRYFTEGTEALYATTTAEGVVADGTADNWNLKFEWPTGGMATLTLKGATISGAGGRFPLSVMGTEDIIIAIEGDSTIFADTRTAVYVANSGDATITGPGKLTINTTDATCINFGAAVGAGKAYIKDANLELNPVGSSTNRMGISFLGGDLIIDNSKVHINGIDKNEGIWGYAKITKNTDGSVKSVATTWKAGENDDVKRNLIIQNGSEITGHIKGRNALGANGDIIIKDSTVEMSVSSAENNFPVFSKKPVLEGEYTAIASEKKDGTGAVTYEASKYANHRYFKITPKTAAPETPDAGGTTGGTTNDNPKTGDTFRVALVSVLALSSMTAMTVIYKKKVI